MTIFVNGKSVTLEQEISVEELLVAQKVKMPEYVTVQINDGFVAKEEFGTQTVKDGDVVEFLYFMGGGT